MNPMIRWGLCASLLFAGVPSMAQQLSHFYCYVPDPASGTVFVSPVMPIGPVAERAGYAAEFADQLRSKGLLRGQAQGYCTMRPSAEAIAKAQSLLPRESCPECAGASRFQGVAWSRNGTTAPAPSIAATQPAPAKGASIEVPTFDSPATPTWLLVMGNRITGKVVVAGNRPSLQAAEKLEAKFASADGWKRVLLTSSAGAGAVVCVPEGGETRFFVAHEQASTDAATRIARQFALQNVDGNVATTSLKVCGGPWDTRVPDDASQTISDALIQEISDQVRREVTCDPARGKPCPPPVRGSANGVRG